MSELSLRRKRVFDAIEEGSAVLVFSGVSKIASEDSYFPFVSNTDFFYLTGVEQENSVLLLVKSLGENKCYLFIDPYDEIKEKWTGKRLTFEEASVISDIHNIESSSILDSKLELLLKKNSLHSGKISSLFLNVVDELKIKENMFVKDYIKSINDRFSHIEIRNIHPIITNLRMIKSSYEIQQIKEAINLTNLGINNMILSLKSGMFEYQLAEVFQHYGNFNKKLALAFPSIVASGKNGVILHYPSQNERLKDGELVLFDLGYRYNNYCADISRTYPISGTFSNIQKEIYEVVLLCNKAVIEYIKPGLTLKELNDFTIEFFDDQLRKRHLLKDDEKVSLVYYHSVSHHLGIDTHDVSDRSRPLEPGNVITVEPGLYFKNYNIGIRIEDDVLVTKTGCEVLSRDIKKEVNEIEKMFIRKKI